jgi:hypothetical protein
MHPPSDAIVRQRREIEQVNLYWAAGASSFAKRIAPSGCRLGAPPRVCRISGALAWRLLALSGKSRSIVQAVRYGGGKLAAD